MSATLTYPTQMDAVLAEASRLATTGPAWAALCGRGRSTVGGAPETAWVWGRYAVAAADQLPRR